jgi:hypothetical protein
MIENEQQPDTQGNSTDGLDGPFGKLARPPRA